MEKFFVIENRKAKLKNIYVSSLSIKTLEEDLENQEKFLQRFESETEGYTHDISYHNIHKITLFDETNGIKINYLTNHGKKKVCFLKFDCETDQQEIKQHLISSCGLHPSKPQNLSIGLIKRVTYLVIGIIVFGSLFILGPLSVGFFLILFISLGAYVALKRLEQRNSQEKENYSR